MWLEASKLDHTVLEPAFVLFLTSTVFRQVEQKEFEIASHFLFILLFLSSSKLFWEASNLFNHKREVFNIICKITTKFLAFGH